MNYTLLKMAKDAFVSCSSYGNRHFHKYETWSFSRLVYESSSGSKVRYGSSSIRRYISRCGHVNMYFSTCKD